MSAAVAGVGQKVKGGEGEEEEEKAEGWEVPGEERGALASDCRLSAGCDRLRQVVGGVAFDVVCTRLMLCAHTRTHGVLTRVHTYT
jgi:hypothetical protein